jgi:hypothetical protein
MLQMGVFFAEGMCFDTTMEGNGGPSGGVPHCVRRSAQVWTCAIGAGPSAIRAAAAGHHFQTLDFLAHGFVEDGVGQEDQPLGAGVGVVLAGFPWTEYARLCGVHSFSSSLWAGSRGAPTPAGPFLSLQLNCTIIDLKLRHICAIIPWASTLPAWR